MFDACSFVRSPRGTSGILRSGASAFTLIELLVVISIIAVMASLLLPAVAMVRSQANTAQCLSGLRQIGMAYFAYGSDNNDQIAPTKCFLSGAYAYAVAPPGITSSHAKWYDLLGPYVEQIKKTEYKRGIFWNCPSFKGRTDTSFEFNDKTGYGRSPTLDHPTPSYEWWTGDDQYDLANATGSKMGTSPNLPVKQYRFAGVTYASVRVLVGDSMDWGLTGDKNNPGVFSITWSDPERHKGKANYLCCDGSAKTLDRLRAWLAMHRPAQFY
jgi:prepilin-type N-terminal cleavage/methylation domain-containing protein/prepilin-type processing-associated H-X9-DG protein